MGALYAGGVGRNHDSQQYLVSLRAVNRSSGNCNTLSCEVRWQVGNASRW